MLLLLIMMLMGLMIIMMMKVFILMMMLNMNKRVECFKDFSNPGPCLGGPPQLFGLGENQAVIRRESWRKPGGEFDFFQLWIDQHQKHNQK